MNTILNIGFENFIVSGRITSILSPNSAPIKRLIQQAKQAGILKDATSGRRTKAVILLDTGDIYLSGISISTLVQRFLGSTHE